MRRFTAAMTMMVGLAVLSAGICVAAETRLSVEAEARQHSAPMAWIPDGAFMMGTLDASSKAAPVHRVYLYAFYLDVYEVTTARYAKFLAAIGPAEPGFVPMFWDEVELPYDGDRPVLGISWNAAEAYCTWVKKRLPTEAEWEKAARGTDNRSYPWGNDVPTSKLANYDKVFSGHRYSDSLRSVDSYESGVSPYGVYGMAGSASEWVADWYDERYYATSPNSNPTGPSQGTLKVMRGGSFGDSSTALKSAARESYFPMDKGPFVGIRCAQDAF